MPIYSFTSDSKTAKKDEQKAQEKVNSKNTAVENSDAPYIKESIDYAPARLGWKVFFYDKSVGQSKQKYLITAGIVRSEAEKDNIEKHLFNLTNYAKNLFFSRAFSERAEEFEVFAFSCPGYEMTLRELAPEAKKACAFKVFSQLISELYDYSCALFDNGQEYSPWGCICEDTVYIKQVRKGGTDSFEIQALPLLPKTAGGDFSGEIYSKNADISTDIHTIADLYFSLKGGFDDTENDRIIKECLIVEKYKDLRPSIERLLNLIDPRGDIRESIKIYSDDSTDYMGGSANRQTSRAKEKKGFLESVGDALGKIKNAIQVDNESTASDRTVTSETED